MSFNDILVETGGFGVFQKFLTFGCLILTLILVSVSYWVQVFILFIPPHRCRVSDNDTQWITNFNETDAVKNDGCHIILNGNQTSCIHGMVYDFSLNFPTYASEKDLVCENAWKMYFVHTMYWIGTIFGIIIFGNISDKYGRRRAYQCAVILTLAADVTTYFCEEYIPFAMTRFCSALGGGSLTSISFVLIIEHTIPSRRRLTICVWSSAFAFAALSMVWLSYLVYNWRYILMISWVSPVLAIIMSYFLPESPSWLITRGRIDEAVEYIQRMARINGKIVSKEFIIYHLQAGNEKGTKEKNNEKNPEKLKTVSQDMDKSESEEEENTMSCYQTLLTVLKSPNLRKRILCLSFLCSAACACYNGNNLEFHNLPFNMYITYSLGALIELPGNMVVMFTLDRIGRRWTGFILFITGGILGILSANVANRSLIVTLVMIMRTCNASSFDVTFSYTSEVIPTVIRGRAISFIRTCGGIGSALAPFVVSLAQKDALLPLACFGIASLLAGLLILTMPETAHKHLPQTIEEGENFGEDQSFWFCPFLKNQTEKESENQKKNLEASENLAYEMDEKEVQCLRIQKLPKY